MGLAAVAYGRSDYFGYVQDQIIGSHTYYDLHLSRPSTIFSDLFGDFSELREYFVQTFESTEVSDILFKLQPRLLNSARFFDTFIQTFLRELDNISEYGVSLPSFLDLTLKLSAAEPNPDDDLIDFTEFIKLFIDGLAEQTSSEVKRFSSLFRIVADNPLCKIYDLPNNKVIALRNELLNEYNARGFEKEFVEIPISDWENEYIYRNTANYATPKIVAYATQNYASYISDHVFSPEVTNGLGVETIADATTRVDSYPVGSSTVNNRLSPAEQKVLEFDLINSPTGIISL